MKKRRRRKTVRIAALLAVILPLAGYGLSNLYLMSPKGRDFLASRISGISGLDSSVEGASWSPWNGISVYGLRIEQPGPLRKAIASPLVSVESARISPEWKELAKRRLIIRAVELRSPRISAPVELLSQLPAPEAPPQIAAHTPEVASAPVPGPASAPGQVPPAVASAAAPETPEIRTASPAPESRTVSPMPTIWVTMTNARVRVLSTSTTAPLFEARDINGKFPLGGKAADSEIRLGSVKSMGDTLAEKMTVPLSWDGRVLKTESIPARLAEVECDLRCSASLTAGIPFQIDAVIAEQSEKRIDLPHSFGATLGSVAGQGRFGGFLMAPGSWQGQFVARARDVEGRFQDQEIRFQNGQALVVFGNAMLRCLDARLVGETTSLLANGTLLKDGRFAGIARIVSSPDTLVAISKTTHPDQAAPNLTPLSTPQRSALDLQVFGRPGKFYYLPDPGAEPIPLN